MNKYINLKYIGIGIVLNLSATFTGIETSTLNGIYTSLGGTLFCILGVYFSYVLFYKSILSKNMILKISILFVNLILCVLQFNAISNKIGFTYYI